MPAKLSETLIGYGFRKQTDIATANVLAGIWRLGKGKLNTDLHGTDLVTEDDAAEIGAGHEFPTQSFLSHWDFSGRIEKYLSSQFAAWAFGFGLGKCVKTGTNPWTYTCTPLNFPVDGIECPYFSYLEQIRPGGSDVLDRMSVGCMVSGITLTLGSGPGRANSRLAVDMVGSGKQTVPSAITLPAQTSEKLLASATLALSINGGNYVSTKKIVSLEATWQNNPLLDQGFYPGSGTQNSAAIRGRIEVGDRVVGLRISARFEDGSDELTKVTAQTEGTAVLTLTNDANNDLTITWHRISFRNARVSSLNGIVTVDVDVRGLYHTSNGLVTAVAKCEVDNIVQ